MRGGASNVGAVQLHGLAIGVHVAEPVCAEHDAAVGRFCSDVGAGVLVPRFGRYLGRDGLGSRMHGHRIDGCTASPNGACGEGKQDWMSEHR